MELPKYNGTCHPNEYVKQIRAYCKLNRITNEQEVLELCILMIDSSITIPDDVNTLDGLINVLKSHSTFTIFKDSCKRKLQVMKYIPEQEENYTATFLAKFRSLCYNAEINNLNEIKNLLFNTYSNEFFKHEIIKRTDGSNSKDLLDSVDELIKLFNDVVFDELSVIRYGSLITLRHVSTGKYLSSCNINYQTGSKRKVVFAEKSYNNPHALWFLKKTHGYKLKKSYQQDMVFYDDKFYLKHKETNNIFGLSFSYKSPTTTQSEAFCWDSNFPDSDFQFKPRNNNNTLYVKSKDIINLKNAKDKVLRSHDFTFTIDNEIFQEVVGHTDRIGGNDEWCIELVE